MNPLSDRKSILLLIWLAAITAFTFPLFVWQWDYFRKPGPGYQTAFTILAAVLVAAGFLYARLRPAVARFEPFLFALLPIALGLFHSVRATLVVGLMASSAYALGAGVLDWLRLEADFALEAMLGLGLLMSIFTWLGLAGALYWEAILAVLLLPLLFFRQPWKKLHRAREAGAITCWHSLASVFGLAFLACASSVVISPSLAFDVIHISLPSVQYYAANHRVSPLPLLPYSYFPQGVETLTASAFALGGRMAAQVAPVLFLGLATLLCRSLARLIGADNSGAWMAALCAIAMPFVHWTGSVGKNDIVLAAFELASLSCLVRWAESRLTKWIVLAAAFLGMSCSVKYIVLYGAVPLVLLILYACWRSRSRTALLLASSAVAVFGFIWPVRAWILTGNPVYPEHIGRSGSLQLAHTSLPWTAKWLSFLSTPWTVHFHAIFASPLPVPAGLFLLLFLPVWFLNGAKWNTAARYCFFFVVLYWLYWSAIWPVLRFGAAPLMLLTVLTACGLFRCYRRAKAWLRITINIALAYSLLFSLAGTMIMEINGPQLRFLARRIDGAEYLRQALLPYPSVEFLRRAAGPSDLVLSVGNCALTYAGAPWNYECLSPRVPLDRIRARLEALPFRFLILPRGFPSFVPLDTPIYEDASFAVYRRKLR